MIGSSLFGAMAHNNAWSNARLYCACIQLSAKAFASERIGFFPSLQSTLQHILLVDRSYLADLSGTGRAHVIGEPAPASAHDLATAQRQIDLRLIAFCDGLDEDALSRAIAIDRGDGVLCRESTAAVLLHLFVHQIHHRGQVHAMLSGTSIEPPQLDEYFLASDEPRRRLELVALGVLKAPE